MKEKQKLHVVSFSGGKDSTAMLLRMIEEDMPIDIILYCDTGLEFPEMGEHIRKVEKYIGREIAVIKSDKDYMWYASEKEVIRRTTRVSGVNPGDITRGYGWSNMFARWCTKHLKVEVIDRYLRGLREEYDLIQYVGIAADEPQRIKDDKVYPLVNWGMIESDCLRYCYDRGFDWGGLYEIWNRVSCWCCPLQSLEDLRKLKKHRPELWLKLKEMDARLSETDRPNFQWTKSLRDIEKRFEVEDEFESMGKNPRSKEFYQTLKERGINY